MAPLLNGLVYPFCRLAARRAPQALHRSRGRASCIAAVLGLTLGFAARLSAQIIPSPMRGAALIILKVTDSTQERSLAGAATISELHFEAALPAGIDTLKDLPEGSWAVRIRSIGYEPRTVIMVARGATTQREVVTVRMVALVPTLTAVNVIARHDQRVLDGIDERMRVASGTLIRAGDPFLDTAFDPSDALRAGRGFFWKGAASVTTRGCMLVTGLRKRGAEVAVYLDGVRIRGGGLGTLNSLVRPNEILAIETYPEVLSAPFLWRTDDACAVVAFWTKHPPRGGGE